MQSPLADGRNSLFDVAELTSCTVTPTRCLGRRVGAPSAAVRHPAAHGGLVCAVTTPTVAILTGSLVGRPVKNGDAHLKHTATEKTAAVPVAEAEPTKVPLHSAGGDHEGALEKPPRGTIVTIPLLPNRILEI